MEEIRKQLRAALRENDVWETPGLVNDILRRLKPYLKGPPVRVIEPEALKAWIDGTSLASQPRNGLRD